jgi:hypothetical protein
MGRTAGHALAPLCTFQRHYLGRGDANVRIAVDFRIEDHFHAGTAITTLGVTLNEQFAYRSITAGLNYRF